MLGAESENLRRGYKFMKLFKHQQDIISDDPKKCGLFLGTGSGKTLTALSLAEGKTLVVAPKTTRDDKTWQKNLAKLGKSLHLTVISKEDLRRDFLHLGQYDTVIFDESHTIAGVTPSMCYRNKKQIPKTSQVFEAALHFIKVNPPKRLYLLTATPIRSPMTVLAFAWLLGKEWPFHNFREAFYVKLPIPGREIWSPRKHTDVQERLGKAVQKLGYTGRLSDYVDVPEQTHKVVDVPLTKEQVSKLRELPTDFPDPIVLIGKKHQVEQGVLAGDEFSAPQEFPTNKMDIIDELHEEFGKVLVFAKYTAQINAIAKYFSKKTTVLTLTGATKERGELMRLAEEKSDCIVIAQSSISAGYELPSFRCTVYASESYSFVDHDQSVGRTLRINNLQKNLYVYLVSGEIDKAVRKAIDLKGDFNEKIYAKII